MSLVNTEERPALRTGPPLLLLPDETTYAQIADVLKVFDSTHGIPGSVALVQAPQPGAGEAVTSEAVSAPAFRQSLAVLDRALNAVRRFRRAVTAASRTHVLLTHVGRTETAVQAARSDQRRRNCIRL